MSRTLTSATLSAIYAQETDQVFIILLEIDHVSLVEPIRVAGNTENITSNGDLFIAYPFEISLPNDDVEDSAKIRLRIDNVDRSIIQSLRSIASPPTLKLMVVRAEAPDTVEFQYEAFELRDAFYDALVIEGTLTLESFLFEPYPAEKFTPSDFPGLF